MEGELEESDFDEANKSGFASFNFGQEATSFIHVDIKGKAFLQKLIDSINPTTTSKDDDNNKDKIIVLLKTNMCGSMLWKYSYCEWVKRKEIDTQNSES